MENVIIDSISLCLDQKNSSSCSLIWQEEGKNEQIFYKNRIKD